MSERTLNLAEAAPGAKNKRAGHQIYSLAQLLGRDKGAVLGLILFLSVVLAAIFAPWVAPHDPLQQNLLQSSRPPAWASGGSWGYPLGTDVLGRDILSRIIYGSRVSLMVGFFGVLIATSIGLILGLTAGYLGRQVDNIIMSVVNILLALPYLLFVVFIAAILGRSLLIVILIFGITDAPLFVRIVRGQTVSLRESDFVLAASGIGAGRGRIMIRHLLPNLIGPVVTVTTFEMSGMIFYEAGLGFLGLSVPPTVPSWGNMLQAGRMYLVDYPWMAAFPGLAIMLTSLGINLLGDWMRDVLDPHLRRQAR